MRQLGNRIDFESLVLAGDVGGTNTTLAIVGRSGRRFDIVKSLRYRTQQLDSMMDAIDRTLRDVRETTPDLQPEKICLSGAGPVRENVCELTNVRWNIDGDEIERETHMQTRVINDFTGISYGIPLLDLTDPEQITPISAPDGASAGQNGPVRAVVGAGTGLGVGYLVEHGGTFVAFPSEGGHSAFAGYDGPTGDLVAWLAAELPAGTPVGAEQLVSGQGIANIAHFFRRTGRVDAGSPLAIEPNQGDDEAARVAEAAAAGDASAAEMMRLFVRAYARFASDAALHFLPFGGLFLAGGIVGKNQRWFLEDNVFATTFVRNYQAHIGGLLARIPVYIVKDYAVSLYGAAHAAYSLMETQETPYE